MGPCAALVEGLAADPARWSLAVRQLALPGLVDVVPAARTVLVRFADEGALVRSIGRLGEVSVDESVPSVDPPTVTIRVRYDGVDLAAVATATARSVDEVVALHVSAQYTVAFCGFAPGFAYLRGLPESLHLPRRPTPRTRVPAGAVAIAAEYSAVYPATSPGGWHLIGSTAMVLFDVDMTPPAVLTPGTPVRFEVA
jgi:KipI family sensor histidine kinase inhibitor